jgi:hypothetical protein
MKIDFSKIDFDKLAKAAQHFADGLAKFVEATAPVAQVIETVVPGGQAAIPVTQMIAVAAKAVDDAIPDVPRGTSDSATIAASFPVPGNPVN